MSTQKRRFHLRTARCAGLALCITLAAATARAELLDAVIATVDTEVILYSEVAESAAPLIDAMGLSALPETERHQRIESAHRQVLEQAIDQKILYREALLLGLDQRMDRLDELVEDRLDSVRDQYATNSEFMAMLESAGETVTDLRERIRKTILAMTMANSKLAQFESAVTIDETELAQYYEDNKERYSHPAHSRARRILITVEPEGPARDRARARLAALREEISLGADFAELARLHSEGPEADNGGMMGWISHDPAEPDLIAVLDSAVQALDTGEVSGIIETEYGFHLVKVEERRPAGTATLEEVRTQIEPQLRRMHAQERYDKWIGELRKRSRVVVHRF